ncbi:unnamed protein product [Microthlaspi erraticum]|uniref:Leucine-rich repeat-containing N-terminal plant-type domain-containing protein n=1 Tax=Microthlaspi erraticum TaxID=1685480 RepID=A0A6D2ISF1_9BRAS|nr:unnamed protein product [Microthlaspi erraticum]
MKIVWRLCLIFSLFNSVFVFASPVRHLCRPDQRDALREFKSEFIEVQFNTKIATWRNNSDCCSWDGISCDNNTGMVIDLDLSFNFDFMDSSVSLSGPLRYNSSLFRLQHLQSLNLSWNNLDGVLPDSIGNLKYLRVLSLFGCFFVGKIPSSLGNLSYLTDLDLSFNNFNSELPDSIGNFKYMKVLSLRGCNLFGKIPSSIGNLSYLTELDLYYNGFTGELPDSMGNLNRLTTLTLNNNKLSGNFPFLLLNLSSLTRIDLSSNQFQGMLPSNMSSLSNLEDFDISGNSFRGPIPSSLFMIPSLIKLVLERNHFSSPLEIGNITSSPSKLEELFLGENNFNGPIPGSILKLVGLRNLGLSFWNTGKGVVDFNIFLHLKSLVALDLSYLNTSSMVDLSIFSHLMSLERLYLSGNNLEIRSSLHLPSPIRLLTLSSCNISEFPKFIQNQTGLVYLDISTNRIGGQVPEWLWRLPRLWYVNVSGNSFSGFEGSADAIQKSEDLFVLDISSNKFRDLPLLPKSLLYFLGSENGFSGEIPMAICEPVYLDTLVLSNNNFSGSIPRCFENVDASISVLHLHNNSLSGILPEESISVYLTSLNVGGNKLSGELPKSLINCTRLEFLNVEDNNFNDTFPFWLRFLPELQILVLRSNEFHGPISYPGDSLSFPNLRIFDISDNRFTGTLPSDYFAGWSALSSSVNNLPIRLEVPSTFYYHRSVALTNKGLKMELVWSGFKIYKTIDISGNRLQGDIPESIGLLKELIVLNMSNNVFTGHILPSLANLSNLQSLDLSQNRLSGRIPPELGKLTFLAWMNFSYNMLEGPIPQGTQIQSQNISSFAENPGLCGDPLQETCGKEEEATEQEEDEKKEEEDEALSWIAAAIGYVPGVFCGLTFGHILASYKPDWFLRIFRSFS